MSARARVRVLLVDDHPVVCAGLHTLTEVDAAVVVVGEAGTASAALVAERELRPDVLLLDVRLPDRSGLEVCREIKLRPNAPRVLFLTTFADNALVLAAMQAGGDGYLLKDKSPREIVAAIRAVMRGATLFDPVARALGNELEAALSTTADPLERLSSQERRVLFEVAAGKTDKEIAGTLGLRPKTVRNYLERVFEKLGVHTRTQAAVLWDRHRR